MLPIIASVSAFVIAYDQSDFFGKVIMLGLFALSVACWVLLIYKIWMIRKVREISKAYQKACEQNASSLLSVDLSGFPKPKIALLPHPYGQILGSIKNKTIDALNKNRYFLSQTGQKSVYLTSADFEFLESHGLTAISSQVKELEKNVYLLSTIAALAPFMGLLGTVWGILVMFSGLHGGGSISSNAAVLGGISTALVTTVLGLIIAIPALVSYNYLRNSIRSYSSDMDSFLSLIIDKLEIQYRKVE
jgi:biopolymer transport protein TolQ